MESETLIATPESDLREGDGLLLQLRSDRRLGHEWDDWTGAPLPDGGSFATGTGLFFAVAALAGAAAAAVALGAIWLTAPRLVDLGARVPTYASVAVAAGLGFWLFWLGALGLAMRLKRNAIPRPLAEAGLLPWVMPKLERVGRWVGISRDRLGNSMLGVYNGLAAVRRRDPLEGEDVLILLPRCLGKEAMQEAMRVSREYGVPMFVAARGRYARQMIAMRRPKGVVAVACERDLVSGIHDVAGRLPVLGSTLRLPDGPCRNTELEVRDLEARVRAMLGLREDEKKPVRRHRGSDESGSDRR